ncbi:hypothetical protein J3Q64DRAFT_1824886 [Phycomyces blakesleeanus]|uniref:Uncharacterized protein n=1 Tax=Phycomyces blakesleeanus TaxID=4837 RepID=A0ABR3APQ3_PHYBL
MADMTTRTSAPLSKRKSILGDLGIKTGGHPSKTPATRTTAAKTAPTKPTAAKPSVAKPSATSNGNTLSPGPGLKRANTVGSAPTARATTTPRPRPLSSIQKSPSSSTNPSPPTVQKSSSTLSRTSNSSSGSASSKPGRKTPSNILSTGSAVRSSPKSPTTPLPKRRSVVPLGPNSPLARRSSVAAGAPSQHVTKRMSTSSLDSLAEVKALKDTLMHREELLEEKDKQLQDLRGRIEQLEKEYSERLDQEHPMLSSSSHLIPCDVSIDSEHAILDVKEDKDSVAISNDIITMHGQEVSTLREQLATAEKENAQLKKVIDEEKERSVGVERSLRTKQELTEKRLEEKEKIHQEILVSIRLDHKKTLENLKGEHERQFSLLRESHQEKERKTTDMLRQDKEAFLASNAESHQTEVTMLKERISTLESTLEESKSVINLRKLEKQLSDHHIVFEEYKRQSEQATEALERRFRDEMQQLQNGSDDTAQAWVEKNRAGQQEIDRLHSILQELGVAHQDDIAKLEAIHLTQLEEAKAKSDAQEAELDGQSHQIESLLFQVETLQTALEAATLRLEEHTVKLHNKDSTESLNGVHISQRENLHRLCEEKLQTRQRDLDELHSRISELKEMHDAQLNRLGHEKAKELQELQRELAGLKEKHQTYSITSEERMQAIAHQHTKEIGVMQTQYQRLVDIKDRELEDYAYRVRALSASRQKELDQFREESTEKITKLEYEIEGYESRVKEFERQTQELKKSLHQWENQGNADQNVIDKLKHDCSAHRDENDQLITYKVSYIKDERRVIELEANI